MKYLLIISVLVGLGRFYVPGHDLSWAGSYEAFAHIWVGFLLAIGLRHIDWTTTASLDENTMAWICLGALTILEVIMFLNR